MVILGREKLLAGLDGVLRIRIGTCLQLLPRMRGSAPPGPLPEFGGKERRRRTRSWGVSLCVRTTRDRPGLGSAVFSRDCIAVLASQTSLGTGRAKPRRRGRLGSVSV
jgi:hypothetical protein